jgi:hypothetical protein
MRCILPAKAGRQFTAPQKESFSTVAEIPNGSDFDSFIDIILSISRRKAHRNLNFSEWHCGSACSHIMRPMFRFHPTICVLSWTLLMSIETSCRHSLLLAFCSFVPTFRPPASWLCHTGRAKMWLEIRIRIHTPQNRATRSTGLWWVPLIEKTRG